MPNGEPAQRPFVVIAHQSAIPHYRVNFYNQLSAVCKGVWEFGVVYDPEQARRSDFAEKVSAHGFQFQVLPVTTRTSTLGGRRLVWQNFRKYLRNANLLITDTHLTNVSYPLNALTRPNDCKWALWGHSTNRNRGALDSNLLSRLSGSVKKQYLLKADAFLAYTEGEKQRATIAGFDENNVYVLNNTIDVIGQRRVFEVQRRSRDQLRQELGIGPDDHVFVTVGRMIKGRRLDFLLEAFSQLTASRPDVRLMLIGSGWEAGPVSKQITAVGPVSDPEKVGEYLTAADTYLCPGMIGLAPLQALCHELPVIGFHLDTHGPEIEYLSPKNSTLLSETTSPKEFAEFLELQVQQKTPRWEEERFQSIAHLTLDNMASRFDAAVRSILTL